MKSQINSVRNPDETILRLRWFKGILLPGDQRERQQIINEIGQDTVMSLAEHIPYMFLERADGSSRECYIFFAIKSEEFNKLHEEIFDQLPEVIKRKFNRREFNRREFNRSHFDRNVSFNEKLSFRSYSEILNFLTQRRGYPISSLDVINFQIPIPPQPIPPSNLSGDHLPSETYNNLLYWLSSRGSGSWESFRFACNTLRIPEPKRVLRRLKLLGHIETSTDGSRWSGTPITLVSVRASDPNQQEFILCGQRSLNLLSFLELEQYAISCIEQPQGNAPHCIRVCLPHTEDISRLVNALVGHGFPIHNEGNASLEFAQALPDWQEWMQTLPRISAPILGYGYEYYDLEESRFINCISHNKTGMYRLKHEKSGQSRVYFFDGVSDRWLQGDWYGLRFLALQHYNQNNQTLNAHYDRETASLYIPRSQRWSEIYERALVLASGCLPNVVEIDLERTLLHYQGIQAEVAELLTSKLNINLHQGKPECMTY